MPVLQIRIHAACSCPCCMSMSMSVMHTLQGCMSMLCPCSRFKLHVYGAKSMLHVHAACPWCMPLLYAHTTFPLHVYAACPNLMSTFPHSMSLLLVHHKCPFCKPILHAFAAFFCLYASLASCTKYHTFLLFARIARLQRITMIFSRKAVFLKHTVLGKYIAKQDLLSILVQSGHTIKGGHIRPLSTGSPLMLFIAG
jgi:hypothetical protein